MARRPITVLHLSDVQFGKDHRFAGAELAGLDASYETLLSRLREDLKGLTDEEGHPLRPDLFFLTGDLAEWGLKSEFKDAQRFLRGICEFLELGPERVVLIPGNHDINRKLCSSYFDHCAGNDDSRGTKGASGACPSAPAAGNWPAPATTAPCACGTSILDVAWPASSPYAKAGLPAHRTAATRWAEFRQVATGT